MALLDTLINIHKSDYRPICMDFMVLKANLLDNMGRSAEAAGLYRECIRQSKKVDDVAITQQLDEIHAEYEVDMMIGCLVWLSKDVQDDF